MFDVGGGELLLIFVAVLLLFGPKKIPEVMRSVGKGLRQFRQAQEDLKQQMRDLSADVEKMTAVEEPIRIVTKPVVTESAQVLPPVSTELESQLPTNEDSAEPGSKQPIITQQVITPKPAESTVARNPRSVKKVFDDTVFDD